MDVREKLVELLTDNLPRIGNLPQCDNPLQYTIDEIGRAVVDQLGWDGVGKENQERYFDYEAFGSDLQMDLTFVQTDDGIFEIR